MKIPPGWRKILGWILFFLVLFNPVVLPIALFIGLILFSTSDKGKEFFDTDRWDTEKPMSSSDQRKKTDLKQDLKPEKKQKKPEQSFSFSEKKSSFLNTLPPLPPMKMPQQNNAPSFGLFGIAAIGLILFSVIADGVVSIPAGHTGVVFSKISGGIQEETLDPGINFKIPFLETVTQLDTRIQEETINSNKDPIEALTKDGQTVGIDITVQYKITPENAPNIVQEIGLDYENKVITPGVRSVVREVITGYDSTELFSQDSRTKAEQEILTQLTENYANKFITLEDTLVRDVKFSDKYLDAIEEKKIAEQQIQKSEFEKQNAEVQKEKKIIEAEAEAESIRLTGEALNASPEVIQLQFVEKMAPQISWGILPDGAIPMMNISDMQK